MKLKNGKLSKGKRTKAKQKLALELLRQDSIIKRFNKLSDKSRDSKAMYCIAGIVKNKMIPTNESKSINQPKSKFTVRTKKENRSPYIVNKNNWTIENKPKEWIRLNYREVATAKILTKQKYL